MITCEERPTYRVTLELTKEGMAAFRTLCAYPTMNDDKRENLYGTDLSKRTWQLAAEILSALPDEG